MGTAEHGEWDDSVSPSASPEDGDDQNGVNAPYADGWHRVSQGRPQMRSTQAGASVPNEPAGIASQPQDRPQRAKAGLPVSEEAALRPSQR